jgi:cysteinyl-tRNA synthetase
MDLLLHNSATRRKERFEPIDPAHVRMYVCGPTVYDLAHIGNARSAIVFDVLARLLRRLYPRVTFVRNVTDVEDKIIARAAETGEPIADLTRRTADDYRADLAALGCLPPDIEPLATAHIPQMITVIERLIARGHAYAAEGHVLFSVRSYPDYGKFSGRSPDELIAGARVEVAPYKRDAGDFVLWKPSDDATPGWDSPWGRGRPGWHIECSAMAWQHLGETFDIHGGGTDLIFPHHENEIAQSCCAFPGSGFARVWLHNGMLRVDGQKMSKSLGNFLTVRDILAEGRWAGEAFRYLVLKTHYRSDLDFSLDALRGAKAELDRFYRVAGSIEAPTTTTSARLADLATEPLADDLNTAGVVFHLHNLMSLRNTLAHEQDAGAVLRRHGLTSEVSYVDVANAIRQACLDLGLLGQPADEWLGLSGNDGLAIVVKNAIAQRLEARRQRDFATADRIRADLLAQGIVLEDTPHGTTWRRAS